MKPTHQKFTENPNYLAYERLLKQLQDLSQAGKNDSEEADAVREKTEDLWCSFSEEEQERLDGLSADLYSLSDEEIAAKPTFDDEQDLRAECEKAFNAKAWEALLGLLRRGSQLFPKAFLAAQRSLAWFHLGHFAPTSWFIEEACRREPENTQYLSFLLMSLARVDPLKVFSQAESVLNKPGDHDQSQAG